MRLLLERVEVTIQSDSEQADVVCVWAGGQRAWYELIRSVRRTSQLTYHGALLDRIRALHRDGVTAPAISRILTAEGWRSAHGKTFTEASVRALMTRMGLPPAWTTRPSTIIARADGECTVAEISGRLNLPEGTVYAWLYKQRLPARRVEVADRSLWLIRLEDVQKLLRSRGTSGRLPPVASS